MSPASTSLLKDRAQMLSRVRSFFAERAVLEADPSPLVPFAPIDANIDVISARVTSTQTGYLHTSPEYALKKLLARGLGDLYYLGPVFRFGEVGPRHNPSFTMIEWYRLSFSFAQMQEETCELIDIFLGPRPRRTLSYREAFQSYVAIDYQNAPLSILQERAAPFLSTPQNWQRSELLDLLLTHLIEPNLGQNELTLLTDYPPNQAALARLVIKNGEPVAERFEIYADGVELANGYHELADGQELRLRFTEINEERIALGKLPYALDEPFLAAQDRLPPCCGVSVGFDRLLMLRHKTKNLNDILPFSLESF